MSEGEPVGITMTPTAAARIRELQETVSLAIEAGKEVAEQLKQAEAQRDENFATIRTICKVLCDLDCPEGCDGGLDYEGDEWTPCGCIFRPRSKVNEKALLAALHEYHRCSEEQARGIVGEYLAALAKP